MEKLTVGEAAARTGWSPRMLRYIERTALVVPPRTPSGYRLYSLRELNQLRSLRELLRRFRIELSDVAFAARLRRERPLRTAIDAWLDGLREGPSPPLARPRAHVALEWEQRKHERLLAA